jgi:hypothetical protein
MLMDLHVWSTLESQRKSHFIITWIMINMEISDLQFFSDIYSVIVEL